MSTKPLSLRSTVVLTIAAGLGALAGEVTQTVRTQLDRPGAGAGRLAGIIVALWAAGKLHALIGDPE